MNILFLSYWGLHDGLTASTVLPHLKLLEADTRIEKIIFCSIERNGALPEHSLSAKIFHKPLPSSPHYGSKIIDFIVFPAEVVKICKAHKIGFMFCRGTPAGALGYLVHRRNGMPYAVESFEPHAEYMRESGIWPRWGLRYILQSYWEKKQMETARYIMPVSQQYFDHLHSDEHLNAKLLLMPCAVDLEKFAFNAGIRQDLRNELAIKIDATVGIYVGKFGGMYYDEEAFHIFALAKKFLNNFSLIILSPDNPEMIRTKLSNVGYVSGEYHIKHVDHSQVSSFLSASDIAFATYKPGYFKRYLSPVKIGEYWAAGLPVMLTRGIGDDYLIIQDLKIGAVFSYHEAELEKSFKILQGILASGRTQVNRRIQSVASTNRNLEHNRSVYDTIINELS